MSLEDQLSPINKIQFISTRKMINKVSSFRDLQKLIDETGPIITNGLNLRANDITTLAGIREIHGVVFLKSDSLLNLGELEIIKGDLFIANCPKLTSLFPLKKITGKVDLEKSSIQSLNSLRSVGVRLNLRGMPNIDFSALNKVGSIYLSSQLKSMVLDFDYDNVKYFKEPTEETSFQTINNVYSVKYRWSVISISEYEASISNNSKSSVFRKNFWLRENKYAVEYYLSDKFDDDKKQPKNKIKEGDLEFERWKKKLLGNKNAVKKLKRTKSLFEFRDRLFYDLFKSLAEEEISINEGLQRILLYINAFDHPSFFNSDLKTLILKEELFNERISEVILGTDFSFGEIHSLEMKLKKRQLDAVKLIGWESSLNNHTRANIGEFKSFLDHKIQKLYKDSYSFMDIFFKTKGSVTTINKEFYKLRDQFKSSERSNWYGGNKEFESFLLENSNLHPLSKYLPVLLEYSANKNIKGNLSYWHKPWSDNIFTSEIGSSGSFNIFLELLIEKFFNVVLFNIENEFRESKGLPGIGKGWISETELYYKIKETFNDFEVVHHGKPEWLGRQHVDIFFPNQNIGIEYQGAQHDKPIDFFGGEEAFKKNQIRDKRKKKLFQANDAVLIEVRPGYDFEELKKQIQKILNKKSPV